MEDAHVTLNVGGKQYLTRQSTLTRYPKSYFKKLFEPSFGSTPPKNEQGHYLIFIDRDGEMFRHILNFMRCGKLLLPTGFSEYELLKCEAEFYSLSDLQHTIKERLRIGLRAGGTIMKIGTEEASREPDSFFAKMLRGQISVPRDSFGNFMIDRDEGMFQLVHRYLQCGGIVFETTTEQLHQLKNEGEFFGLQMLLHHIESIRFMRARQQIDKGSTRMFVDLFYHKEDQCVVYANKAVLSGWLSSWAISSICQSQGCYTSNLGVFAGIVDEKHGFKVEDGYSGSRSDIIRYIHKKMGGNDPHRQQLKTGWSKVTFISS